MNGEHAYRFGLANAQRNSDGTIVEESLVQIVAHAIDFDVVTEALFSEWSDLQAGRRVLLREPLEAA